MQLIRPFRGLRPAKDKESQVVAPPYDVLNTEEARVMAEGRSSSFLHISKPEIDLPPGTDPHDPEVYRKGAENLQRLLAEGVLQTDEAPCYYFYSMTMNGRTQKGLVAAASVKAYDQGLIKKHEFTRPDKEDDRVRQIDELNAQTGPVLLAYRGSDLITKLIRDKAAAKPQIDVVAHGDVRHQVWVVDDEDSIEAISNEFSNADGGSVETLYIADGHHRSAAASRVAGLRAQSAEDAPANFFLSVIFDYAEMEILDYNRVVKDLNGLDHSQFIEAVKVNFDINDCDEPYRPTRSGDFGMYLDGKWHALALKPHLVPIDDPVGRLDVSLLTNNLIHPILGIEDQRRDKRIDFVGGIRGLKELERRVNDGGMAVAFSLYPTQMADLMAVADAGEVMPPKSTWFEPKLADGLVSHWLE